MGHTGLGPSGSSDGPDGPDGPELTMKKKDEKEAGVVEAFKCPGCTTLIEISTDSNEYFTIYGNILLGDSGGIIGGELPELSQDIKPFRICIRCLKRSLDDTIKNEVSERLDDAIKDVRNSRLRGLDL